MSFDEQTSRLIAERALRAVSSSDITDLISDEQLCYYFENESNWQPYGGRPKNWDTVGNQQANAVGALVELITNGVDAILLRKARESGLSDMRSLDAPQSMFEAVKQYFPHVVEGRIANLSPTQRTELAEAAVVIGVQRAERKNGRYPTYTVIDSGDGQPPDEFPKTFLSLSERNKEGIPFVQGKFNMGSTGSLRFSTRSDILLGHYKLIVSRRPGTKYWGWTLLRVRKPRQGEGLPVAEYFCPGGQIPRFRSDSVPALDHSLLGQIKEGTIVKLYEFDVGQPAYQVDVGLDNALTMNLLDCALPVRIYDFDAKPVQGKGDLRKEGIAARTFSGMSVMLIGDESENSPDDDTVDDRKVTEWQKTILEEKHEELGHIKIVATGIRKLKEFLEKSSARIFYTVNGQTHAVERASFLNTKVGRGDLRNHLLVNVVCDKMDKTALANIFMPDRERKAHNNQSRQLEEIVATALKEDEKIRSYAAEIRLRRAKEYSEDAADSKDFLEDLVDSDPDIRDLFGLGKILINPVKVPGGTEPFNGKKFPTLLAPLNLKSEGEIFIKDVPINAYRKIECGTDAENEYLSRIDSPGESWCSLSHDAMPHSVKLHNGTATFTIRAPKGVRIGEERVAEFGFIDNGPNVSPLKFSVLVRYTKEEDKKNPKGGVRTDTNNKNKPTLALPRFQWVSEQDWGEHSFDGGAGAYVSTDDETTVYINRDNRALHALRLREKDDAQRSIFETMFKFGLGVLSLAIHKRAAQGGSSDDVPVGIESEDIVRLSTSAIAAHIVTLIRRLGGTEFGK